MNRAIARLFAVMVLLFAVLVAFTSRWTVFSATALQNNTLNKLGFYASEKIKTGDLLADNGAVLAKAVPASGGVWRRKYPFGSLFAQPVGYSILQLGQFQGLEQYRAAQLRGVKTALTSVFGSLGGSQVGDDVQTTLDPKAQARARALLGGRTGSVIAIVPQTGAVKVMYSNPTYNDNDPQAYQSPNDCKPNPFADGCLVNLATQGLFPPGSTFKVVTSTAALDSGKYTPESIINGPSPLEVSGAPLENDGNHNWGDISLTTALINSVNTVYAQVGQDVGPKLMETYMKRFGFYAKPPLDYPTDQMSTSGEQLSGGKLIEPTNPLVDLGRMSIGQDKLAVTPMQMAMVVATVANGGVLMEPRLTTEVVNSDGQVVQRFPPTEYDRVMKPKTASELTQMMEDVVEEGTGTPAQLDGIKVAGKTGTASVGKNVDGQPLDDAWFIGFAPVDDPKIAVAVTLEKIPNGYGGTYAAPIAAQVIKTLLAEDR